MIQRVYGVKEFQTNLPKISSMIAKIGGHYLVTKRNKPTMVAIPFEDYKEIEDIILELNSPVLQADIKKGRRDFKFGKTKSLEELDL